MPFLNPSVDHYTGSGFVVKKMKDSVLMLTNAHVVKHAALIQVRLRDTGEQLFDAKLRLFCDYRDLAVVEVMIKDGPEPLQFTRDSLEVRQGDRVYVIGHPMGERHPQITSGDVSGFSVDEDLSALATTSYIQVSAAINPGNSGGPAFNANGEVIGITAAGILLANNIGYLIPSNNALGVLNFADDDVLHLPPTLGIRCNRNHNRPGLYVYEVQPNSIFWQEKYDDTTDNRIKRFAAAYHITDRKPKTLIAEGDTVLSMDIVTAGTTAIPLHVEWREDGTARLEKYERTIHLDDVESMINLKSEVVLQVMSETGKTRTVRATFDVSPVTTWMVRPIFPQVEPGRYRWMVLAGAVIFENMSNWDRGKDRFMRTLCVTHVLHGGLLQKVGFTTSHSTRCRLQEVNNTRVFTLKDVEAAMASSPELKLKFSDGTFVFDRNEVTSSDSAVLKIFLQDTGATNNLPVTTA